MTFKTKFLSAAVISSTILLSSTAVQARQIDEARVVSADPVYRTVRVNTPQEQCWDEPVQVRSHTTKSKTPEILGAIIGAAVGRNFGSGRGQDVATVAGAVLGGSIGHDVKNKRAHASSRTVYEKRCEVVDRYHTEERIEGYDVTYTYNGQTYTTFTQYDPGDTIRVSVNVVPAE